MKFLAKNRDSAILAEGLTYKANNARLRERLLAEQMGFCAYTEKRVGDLDSVDVEHFDRTKKGRDDYFNYYATLHEANLRKMGKEKRHAGAAFFTSLFFQNPGELAQRIRYVSGDGVYEEIEDTDEEARDLIDFLGFNDSCLSDERAQHVRRLRHLFRDARYGAKQKRAWFTAHPEELSFITAIEAELELDLSAIADASAKTSQ
jgi:hypothetical protein